jgi:sugar/nucleoside kinase (ribokinase family)
MTRAFDVMVAGHLCLDIIPRFPDTGATRIDEIMRPGKLVNVDDMMISTGGPVSNTGLNLKKLGLNICFCACVGQDRIGKITADILQESGNAEGISPVDGVSSSYTVVVAPPGIDRIFLHNPGTNNVFGPENLDPALIAQCRHFHFGYPPLMSRIYGNDGKDLAEVFRIAKEAGATTSCDMTLPDPSSPSGKVNWRAILENILPYVDIYLPSIEETFYMLDPEAFLRMKQEHRDAELIDVLSPEEYARIANECLAMGAKMVSLKAGHRGFYLKTGPADGFDSMGAARPGDPANWANRELWAPAFVVEKLASATGSGDSAIAGLLATYVRGLDIETALKYATCLGWQNLQVLDAVSGIHTWEETTALLASGMPLIDIHNTSPGWKWHESRGLWAGPQDSLNH